MKGNSVLLIIIAIMLGCNLFFNYTNFQQIQVLKQENITLLEKIDSVQQICSKKSRKQTSGSSSAKPAGTGSAFLDFLLQVGEEEAKEAETERAKQKVVVSTKYRLEDRYVSYKVYEPELIGEQTGEVILKILVDRYGDVKSAKLQSATGITNEMLSRLVRKLR